jgi:putative transposase
MYKNKHHNRRIDRANWMGIIEKLSYKSIIILVNPAYTSTTCPICGSKMESQEGQVVYCCNCMNSFNRQFVGCFNIFRRGLGKIKEFMGGLEVASTGAEVSSLKKLMTPNPNVVYGVDLNGKYLIMSIYYP